MKAPAATEGLDQESGFNGSADSNGRAGVGRRGFLSLGGGGLLAGAGLFGRQQAPSGLAERSALAELAAGSLPRIYPADPRYATMRMGFNRR